MPIEGDRRRPKSRPRNQTDSRKIDAWIVGRARRQRRVELRSASASTRKLHSTFQRQYVYTDDIIETQRLRVELSHLVHCPTKLPLTDRGNDPLRTPQILWFNREKHDAILLASSTCCAISPGVKSLQSQALGVPSTWSFEHEKTGADSTQDIESRRRKTCGRIRCRLGDSNPRPLVPRRLTLVSSGVV
jgi:hypothetical protein